MLSEGGKREVEVRHVSRLLRGLKVVLPGRGGASGLCLRREHATRGTVRLQTQRQAMRASASNISGEEPARPG